MTSITGNLSSVGLRRPSSGRRSKRAPTATGDHLPIYVQPFEQNNAWSTLVCVSPQSTVAEVRHVVQAQLQKEQARPCEWYEYQRSRPSKDASTRPKSAQPPKEEQLPDVVYNDELLSENMRLCDLQHLRPYTTLKLERPSSPFASARRKRPTSASRQAKATNNKQKVIPPSEPDITGDIRLRYLKQTQEGKAETAMEDAAEVNKTEATFDSQKKQEKPEDVQEKDQDGCGVPGAPVLAERNVEGPVVPSAPVPSESHGEADVFGVPIGPIPIGDEPLINLDAPLMEPPIKAEKVTEESGVPEGPSPIEKEIEPHGLSSEINIIDADFVDEDLDKISPRMLDIGEMPLHSRPVSPGPDLCQPERGQTRCASSLSTVAPSPSPCPYDSLPTSPSPIPPLQDDSFQEVIKDLEMQLSQERISRKQMHDSFVQERAQLLEDSRTLGVMRNELHENREQLRSYEEKYQMLESSGAEQKRLSIQATQALEDDREKLKDKEREWELAKESLERQCDQYQNRCWELKEEQRTQAWRLEDELQSTMQELKDLKEERGQESIKLEDKFKAELYMERKQAEDHAQYLKTELSEAHASQEASKAVRRLSLKCVEALPSSVVPAEELPGPEVKEDCVELFPLLYLKLTQHYPGIFPSKEECHELFPLLYSKLAQQHATELSDKELKQECAELLPLLCQELQGLPDAKSSASSSTMAIEHKSKDEGDVRAKDSAECDMLRESLKRLEAELNAVRSEREEEVKLLKEAQQTQEEKKREEHQLLVAEGAQLRGEVKRSKHGERRMKHVLFWSTYCCGAVCAITGAVMYFVLRDS